MPVKVSIYEDNDSLRESLSALIGGTEGFECTGAHINCKNVEANTEEEKPDVVMMDIEMPVVSGTEGVARLKKHRPAVEIIMLTVFNDDEHIFECLGKGASGYILKGTPPAKILEAIQEVYNGGSPMSAAIARRVVQQFKHSRPVSPVPSAELTSREKELLALLTKGNSYKMIARDMGITIHTVQQHIKHIYTKLHVHNMGEAVAKAVMNRFV